jgi:hypothetical protein
MLLKSSHAIVMALVELVMLFQTLLVAVEAGGLFLGDTGLGRRGDGCGR